MTHERCHVCGHALDEYGDCDSCTFDRECERAEQADREDEE